jgi:hypothetical protein
MIRRLLLILSALLLWSSIAQAGTLVVHDSTGTLTSSDESALKSDASDWPFDVNLLLEAVSSKSMLENDAHAAVTRPNVVAIALDPVHHKIVTRFGASTGVKVVDFDTITSAGNAHFHSGEWRQGIEAVALRAKASAQTSAGVVVSSTPVIVEQHQGLAWSTWLIIALLVGALVSVVVWVWRKARYGLQEIREEAAEMRSHNIKEQSWEDSVQRTSVRQRMPSPFVAAAPRGYAVSTSAAPTTVVVNNDHGSGDLATGIILGEALADRRQPVVEREVVYEKPSRSVDGGGSDSSWGSGSSSSSSSDSGGSSSSYDSGGSSSFDSGGGGFDFGGGGSDF